VEKKLFFSTERPNNKSFDGLSLLLQNVIQSLLLHVIFDLKAKDVTEANFKSNKKCVALNLTEQKKFWFSK
jgi:hypothetical protein